MKKLFLLFIIILMGCSNTSTKIEEIQESINSNGDIVKVFTKFKTIQNGNMTILNGVSTNDKFTGNKETVLFNKSFKGGVAIDCLYNISILEIFEKNKLKNIEYILKYNSMIHDRFFGSKGDFEQIISFAKISYLENNIKFEMESIANMINPKDTIYKPIPYHNLPHYFIQYRDKNSKISKNLIAMLNTKTNTFTIFNYSLNGQKANTKNFSNNQKFQLIDELSRGQMENFFTFFSSTFTQAQSNIQAFNLILDGVQNSLNHYQINNNNNNNRDILKHRVYQINSGYYIESTEKEARQNIISEFNKNNKAQY